jgi:hypothetical protein
VKDETDVKEFSNFEGVKYNLTKKQKKPIDLIGQATFFFSLEKVGHETW